MLEQLQYDNRVLMWATEDRNAIKFALDVPQDSHEHPDDIVIPFLEGFEYFPKDALELETLKAIGLAYDLSNATMREDGLTRLFVSPEMLDYLLEGDRSPEHVRPKIYDLLGEIFEVATYMLDRAEEIGTLDNHLAYPLWIGYSRRDLSGGNVKVAAIILDIHLIYAHLLELKDSEA